MLPWSRFDSDWFPWSSNGKSKIQPVTKCQCPVTGPGTPLHLLNWPVHHHQILIFRSLPLLTLIVSIFAEREWRATFWEMSTAANRVAIFLSSVLFSFQKCTWLKIAEDTVTHWSRIVPIIASIFLIDSVNPVSNPQMVQRRGALISGWKSTTFKTQTLEKRENLRLLQNWEEQCSMQSLVNLYSLG